MTRLVKPSAALFDAFLAMSDDYRRAGEPRYQRDGGWTLPAFEDYLRGLADLEAGTGLPPNRSPQAARWLLDDAGRIVGVSRLRTRLTDELRVEGGNVGCDVPPSRRRRGHGTELLRLTLDEAWDRGMAEVLVTCDRDNAGSRKIIEANSGVLDSEGISPESGLPILRFRIARPARHAADSPRRDTAAAPFVPGLDLAEGFFRDHVQPLLAEGFPALRYSAGLVGHGSEVLGFDTPVSTDHHWGPRVMLFLTPGDRDALADPIRAHLGRRLPVSYRGWSTTFTPPDPDDNGTRLLRAVESGPVDHLVEVLTIEGFFRDYLALDAGRPPTAAEWLSLPAQKLRAVTSGRIFRDDLDIESARRRLAWYPRDVHLFVLGCLWTRIGQEEHLVGRAGQVGDELGSALIGARLVRDLMRIAFCLEQRYPPYPKWFGTAFGLLPCAARLVPPLAAAVAARTWGERQAALADAGEAVLEVQRAAGLPCGVTGRSMFFGRPFVVIGGGKIADGVFAGIEDPDLRLLAKRRPVGSIDLVSDSTDVVEDPGLTAMIRTWYRP